ncbi:hypothetical protein [Agromyces mangrovi Wang et al. 2018]|uniref:hypothetical protein n=1 Tax=Agromyces mangrovi TaxID=1858653 RepID=UPI00257301D3|nr:hypothetical protein [Agromyces mangrovi]BDZ64933.1 hypothetical protein GCM10025877_18710 [Agromyces mangrovi]
MDWWVLPAIIAVAVVAVIVATRLGWIDFSNKAGRTSGSAGLVGIGDEVFAPRKHEAQVELDRQTLLPAPAPLPGDGDKGIVEAADAAGPDASDDDALPQLLPEPQRRAAAPDRFAGRIRLDVD